MTGQLDVHVQPANEPTRYPYPCCNKEGNQVRVDEECTATLTVTRCMDCGRRQREMIADSLNVQVFTPQGPFPPPRIG